MEGTSLYINKTGVFLNMSNIKEVAIAYWRLQKWIASVDVDRKIAAESSLRTLKIF